MGKRLYIYSVKKINIEDVTSLQFSPLWPVVHPLLDDPLEPSPILTLATPGQSVGSQPWGGNSSIYIMIDISCTLLFFNKFI